MSRSGKSGNLSEVAAGLTGRAQRPNANQVRGTAEVAVTGEGDRERGLQAAVGEGRVPELWRGRGGGGEQVRFGCAPT